jgi:nitrous oxidase accessory protein NosD
MRSPSFRRLGTLGALLGAVLAAGASTGLAATEIVVDCGSGADLQAAINAAPKDAILDISGRCVGSFTVAKNLTLKGVSAAVLDAGSSSSGPTTDPALTISSGTVKVKTLTITGANTSSFLSDGGLVNFGTATLVRTTV